MTSPEVAADGRQIWRVVFATGEVRWVWVTLSGNQPPWTAEAPTCFGTEHGATPWAAVVRLTLRWPDRPREILAPGELTRTELAEAERHQWATWARMFQVERNEARAALRADLEAELEAAGAGNPPRQSPSRGVAPPEKEEER